MYQMFLPRPFRKLRFLKGKLQQAVPYLKFTATY